MSLKGAAARASLVATGEATHTPLHGVPSPPHSPLQRWRLSASHYNEEGWEEAKPCLCPRQGMCSLSWDSNPRQSRACQGLGEKTQGGFLFSFLLAFESHSKTVVCYLIRGLKLPRI